nr:TetR family transcriptional regulator C-terminal domain-containing protein [Brevibacterium luteolum]
MDVLRAETVGRVLTAELEDFREVVETETSTRNRLRLLTELLTRAGREGASALWLDAWSYGLRVLPIAAEVRAHMDAWQAFIQQLIEVAVDAGDVECRDPDATAWHIIAVADGLNAHGLVQYRDREALRRQLAKAIGESLGLSPEDLCS